MHSVASGLATIHAALCPVLVDLQDSVGVAGSSSCDGSLIQGK